jgi:hypothetical protein
MTDAPSKAMDELENIIRDLIERKNALPEDSPEHVFVVR